MATVLVVETGRGHVGTDRSWYQITGVSHFNRDGIWEKRVICACFIPNDQDGNGPAGHVAVFVPRIPVVRDTRSCCVAIVGERRANPASRLFACTCATAENLMVGQGNMSDSSFQCVIVQK